MVLHKSMIAEPHAVSAAIVAAVAGVVLSDVRFVKPALLPSSPFQQRFQGGEEPPR